MRKLWFASSILLIVIRTWGGQVPSPGPINPINPVITTPALPDAMLNKPYSFQLRATGCSVYEWTVNGLPRGLSVNRLGLITGTPSQVGTFTVAVSVRCLK
jgi:hypothetical protein